MRVQRVARQVVPLVALALSPALIFVFLQFNGELDIEGKSPEAHFYLVSAAALVAAGVGGAGVIGGLRGSSGRLLLLATAFLGMGVAFAVHGLTTPGFLVHEHHRAVGAFSSRLSLVIAAVPLALSTMSFAPSVTRVARRWRFQLTLGWCAVIAAYGIVAFTRPQVVPLALVTHPAYMVGTYTTVVVLAGWAAFRYLGAAWRTATPVYAAAGLGAVLLVEAQMAMHFGDRYHVTWWLYHIQLLMGSSAIAWAMLVEFARGNIALAHGDVLALHDPIAHARSAYVGRLIALAEERERREGAEGHGARVATLAQQIGARMGLRGERLRGLGLAAMLLDIGKAAVPERLLQKPGKLHPAERAIVQEHVGHGEEMLHAANLGPVELATLRHHHERFDGAGYPDARAGLDIPLGARILAVASVYSALRASRAHRPGWTREAALHYMRASAGSEFDPECVDAFFAVLDRWEAGGDRSSTGGARDARAA